ncbi:sodium/hydrogen exchanger 8-like isoform X1 [Polyodon spathula]|uniref:sodium/hydrogen exchanger 8-like isoform X1 n=1 Tax=Polyodon spathula TaxID=7913 RepID=UPI001B7F57F8|nr:sodium/hydrogen exchanger 8-like isoform X1 [Polyodon spathula]XP_041112567.1 sodium/hydrogen exchanger 8-like isoform X1 [Polyodon spathula]
MTWLTNTAEGLTRLENSNFSGWQTFLQAHGYFLKMFFSSAALGTLTGLISALRPASSPFWVCPYSASLASSRSLVIWCIGSQDHTQHDVHHVVQWIVSCNPLCPEPPFESGATIVIMLLTILLLVGSTMYLIRLIDIDDCKSSHKYKKDINLSKMEKVGNTIESEHLSELTEEEYDAP